MFLCVTGLTLQTKPASVNVTRASTSPPPPPFLLSSSRKRRRSTCRIFPSSVVSVNVNSPLLSDRSSLLYRTYLCSAASGPASPLYLPPHTHTHTHAPSPSERRVTPPPPLHPLLPADSPLAVDSFTSRPTSPTSPHWIPVASQYGTDGSHAPVSLHGALYFLLC